MRRFWAAGYAATSVRDLGDAMGLGPASVYNAFGDKRTLFSQCLDRYLDANMRARIARVEKTLPPRQAIEDLSLPRSLNARLRAALVAFWSIRRWRWRRMTRTLPTSSRRGLASWRLFFRRCVIAGQRDGSISPDADAKDAARLLVTTVMGLRVLARGHPERAVLEGAVRQALSLLGKPDRKRKLSARI